MIQRLLNKLDRSKTEKDFIAFENLNLPIIRSNEGLIDNSNYLQSGAEQVNYLIQNRLINQNSEILDFGCGQGRFLNTLKYTNQKFKNYKGLDTSEDSINWCAKYLKYSDEISFIHLPAANARYNPNEKGLKPLPFAEKQFDLIFLNSVFSHMLTADVKFYLSEFNKGLKDSGNIYITAFIEENVPEVEENPANYLSRESTGALHRVRYEKNFFFDLVANLKLNVVDYRHQHIGRTKQSVVVLNKQKITEPELP